MFLAKCMGFAKDAGPWNIRTFEKSMDTKGLEIKCWGSANQHLEEATTF
jgi:hypothetical protein